MATPRTNWFCPWNRNAQQVLGCGARRSNPERRDLLCAGEAVAGVPVILVVEDEESIQSALEDALNEGGFDVAFAMSGEEAVTLLKSGLVDYQAVVIDISLRGRMSGWEVAQSARRLDPAFPIIYTTGVSAPDWPALGVPNSVLLAKPFAPAQLITAISQLLNTGAQRAI
jgi:CheY-like chemotaxis protein